MTGLPTARLLTGSQPEPGGFARCTLCGLLGEPYAYRGREFDGLTPYEGDQLCPTCRDAQMDAQGVDILVIDDRPTVAPYVTNTARDRDTIRIWLPPDRRGIDGRDARPRRRGRRGAAPGSQPMTTTRRLP